MIDRPNDNQPSPTTPAGASGSSSLGNRDIFGQDSTRRDSIYPSNELKIPTIELPKGGGALKGIDEKFQVNPANGTASFSVPLPISKTRNDFAPSLSLGYDSGSGNGAFGLGWNLNYSRIQRRTDKKLPQYKDSEESDVFLLSGSEDLVPALLAGGLPDEFTAPTGERVKRYRPRLEGAFARIEKITPAGSSSSYWKVTTKTNIATFYGRNTSARIADPSTPVKVFEWLPELSYDDKGNCIEFEYVAEDFQNVPNTLPERNRLNLSAPVANTYLKRVHYGNKNPYYANPAHPYNPQAPVNPEYFFELVFDYGDHDPNTPTPAIQTSWPCRLEPFSTYKSGFDIRTYRLCRRVLSFHYFKELNDGVNPAPCLVRSLDFDYRFFNNPAATPQEIRNCEVDFPIAIRQLGYAKNGGSYDRKGLPPVQFTYQELNWNKQVQTITAGNLANAPVGLSRGYQWVDLFGEGINGILTEQAGAWLYKSNLGNGSFTPAQVIAPKPSLTGLAQGSLQLQDIEADGRKSIVVTQPPMRGYFELSDDGAWQPFTSFRNVPNVDMNDPNVKFIDLDGDGRSDLVISEENVFLWFPSEGMDGYAAPEFAGKPLDEENGPALVFSDSAGSIFLANMSGSGMTDIVRVRNGEVCYWPNTGYGRFGAKVTMNFAPVFDSQDLFNPSYLHLADISGTGATDILYLGKNRFRAWINQSGNAWSEEANIDPFPTTESPSQLTVADLLGNGTACIVWSSPLAKYSDRPMRYVDLMGGNKPYLINGYRNNFGKELELEYKSSTFFYLRDKQAGTPWVTKLPFPVQCVTRVKSTDHVTGAYLSTEYVYHHGYYDHPEREYRGFGMVEQTDTETFAQFVRTGASNIVDQPLYQAPVLTKTWFHTGAFFKEADLLARFRSEFYQNPDFAEYHLPAPVLPPVMSTAQEMREAYRACKGMMIRQETYAVDGISNVSDVPYTVREQTWLIQMPQPRGANRYAVFLTTESESITYSYERNRKDPRIAHSLNIEIDPQGNVLQSASVAYPRQVLVAGLPAKVNDQQKKLLITYTLDTYTNDVIAAPYRLRQKCETSSFELTGVTPLASYFTREELAGKFAAAALIQFEVTPDGSAQKRRLKQSRTLFLKDDLSATLPLKQMDPLGLVSESFHLTFTSSLLTALYGARVTTPLLAEGGYLHSDDFKASGLFPASDANNEWWTRSGQGQYPAIPQNSFYLPNAFADPFGNVTSVRYFADYHLLVDQITNAAGNITTVDVFDFRGPTPRRVKDANDNFTEVRIDIRGVVTGAAIEGKGAEADDFTGFSADLSDADVANFFSDPVTFGPALLQHATKRFVYDFSTLPVRVGTIARETHFQATIATGVPSKLQYRFEYSDGFGNVAMKKAQAEPGIAKQLDAGNNVIEVNTSPKLRWIGDGRTVRNNKGKVVKKYEPYFSVTHLYEDDPKLVDIGVSPILFYDPPGRVVKTVYPDGTFSKTGIEGWLVTNFDQNDTVVDSDWYTLRTTGALAGNVRENQAALKAAVHYDTPVVIHFDTLGRQFYTVNHNKFIDHITLLPVEKFYESYVQLDIENNPKQVVDARGNTVFTYGNDVLGNGAHSTGMDTGERFVLSDCTGKQIYAWDSKNQMFHTLYDAARRPVQSKLTKGANPPIVIDQIAYGEGLLNDKLRNLRARVAQQNDQAGIVTNVSYDFKGNLLETNRVMTTGFQNDVDWSAPPPMSLEVFTTSIAYDALNRPAKTIAPYTNPATANTLTPGYNEAALLETMEVNIRGAGAATHFVTNIDYNEKGQRERIEYANGASTIYKYDPNTFRLIALVTARNADPEIFWDDPSKIALPANAGKVLQFLTYTYDPVGNITFIKDDAQQATYYNNVLVEPSCDYTYDAMYWLVESMGREHIGARQTPDPFDVARMGNPQPGDGTQMQTYTLQYDFDDAGNMIQMKNVGNWSMAFTYAAANNQLLHAVPSGAVGTPFTYPYDAHGNVTAMPHLQTIDWDFRDRLRHTAVSAGGPISQESFYVYDSSGQRVRKVVLKGNITEDRYYLGSIEIFRRSNGGALTLERESLHVTDDKRRIAIVDTPTVKPVASSEAQLIRYQYSNHLGTACLELDDSAQIISYEEYYAFGSTSYQGTDQSRELPAKRYRYTDKERDEETGFYYHGARYYAPWLARWTAPDPVGMKDGLNLYSYVNQNPVRLRDPNGHQGEDDLHGAGQSHHHPAHNKPKPAQPAHSPGTHHSQHTKGHQQPKGHHDSGSSAPPPLLWRLHIPTVPHLHLDPSILRPPIHMPPPAPVDRSLLVPPPDRPVFPSFMPPFPPPAPEVHRPTPLLREDAQAALLFGFDPGSSGAAIIFNAALTLPHLNPAYHITPEGDSADFWGENRVGFNVLSGFGPLIQAQRIEGAPAPPSTASLPVFRSQVGIGVGVNIFDLQIRRRGGTLEHPTYEHALIDIQGQAQYLHQFLTDPLGGPPISLMNPAVREADQIGIGINIDIHITRHLSLFFQGGGQGSTIGGWGWAPIVGGLGVHSEEQ